MPYELFRGELRAWVVERSCETGKPLAEIASSPQALSSIVRRIAKEYMGVTSKQRVAELYRVARAWLT